MEDDEQSNVSPYSTVPSSQLTSSIKVLNQNATFTNGSRSQAPSNINTVTGGLTPQQSQLPPSVLSRKTNQSNATTGRGITGSQISSGHQPQSQASPSIAASATPSSYYPPSSKLTSKNTQRLQTKLSAVTAFTGGSQPLRSTTAAPTTAHSLNTQPILSPPPPSVMTSIMTPYQTSAAPSGQRGTTQPSNFSRIHTLAAPSKSAEEQWLESVVHKSGTIAAASHMESQSQGKCSGNTCSRSRSHAPTQEGTGMMTSSMRTHPATVAAHASEEDTCSQMGNQDEDPRYAHERLNLMQTEVDHVIGVMKMDFGKSKSKGGIGADKRLSEIYHQCPDYPDYGEKGWRSKKWGDEGDDEAEKRRRRRYRKQMCVLIIFFVVLVLLVGLDYWLSEWFIGDESEELLKESNERMEGLKKGEGEGVGGNERSGKDLLEGDDGNGGGFRNESTTVAVITQIEEEDIKATFIGGDVEEERSTVSLGGDEVVEEEEDDMSLRRGHDVLEPAHVKEEGEEEELVAINMKA